ncbi:MAG: site-2 protease family protein [Dehalococcoidia bacterium]|nr:site-2 protease family protein [Dehalococcoidia bacterium]
MGGTLEIGKVRGIPIRVHLSWVFIFVLVTWSLASSYYPENNPGWSPIVYWTTALLSAAAFFLSILLHELSHSLVALSKGIAVNSITLFIFGGVSELGGESEKPMDELLVSVVGPSTSLVIGGGFWLLDAYAFQDSSPIGGMVGYLAYVNVIVGIFNMMPAYPLDGGRVLRSVIWMAQGGIEPATRVAATISQLIAFAMIGGGIFFTLTGGGFSGVWIALIGWFLQVSAASSYQEVILKRSLQGIKIRNIVSKEFTSVDPNIFIHDLVEDYLLSHNQRAFPVVVNDSIVGLISFTDVKNVPREEWSTKTVRQAMTPAERLQVAKVDDLLSAVLARMATHDLNQMPVLENGTLVGFISRGGVMQYLNFLQELRAER